MGLRLMALGSRSAVLACAVAATALTLAACATTVNGTGERGALLPSTAGPTRSTPASPSPSPTPRTSAPTTPTTPTTSAPTTSGPPTPDPRLLRVPQQTAIGDPVTANFCTGGAGFLRPLHMTVVQTVNQFAGGCKFQALGAPGSFDIFETADPPLASPLAGFTTTRVNGHKVYRAKLDSSDGNCERVVAARGLVVDINLRAFSIAPNSPQLCQAADLTASRVALLLNLGHDMPAIKTASPSVTRLDMCNVAAAAGLAGNRLVGSARLTRSGFGAECVVRGAKLTLIFDTATDSRAGLNDYDVQQVAGHRIFDQAVPPAECLLVSEQGLIRGNGRVEEIRLDISGTGSAATVCAAGRTLFASFLDTAALK